VSNAKSYKDKIYYPEGDGPFMVAILSHGRGGASPKYHKVAMAMAKRGGMAAIVLDHYSERGLTGKHGHRNFTAKEVAQYRLEDVLNVLKDLKNHPKINRKKVVLSGWSAGAGIVVPLISNPLKVDIPEDVQIVGAVLTYPSTWHCYREIESFNVPTLMLYGSVDGNDGKNGNPLSGVYCWKKKVSEFKNNKHPVILKIFDGAYHMYDFPHLKGRPKRCIEQKYRDGVGKICYQFNPRAFKQHMIENRKFLFPIRDK